MMSSSNATSTAGDILSLRSECIRVLAKSRESLLIAILQQLSLGVVIELCLHQSKCRSQRSLPTTNDVKTRGEVTSLGIVVIGVLASGF